MIKAFYNFDPENDSVAYFDLLINKKKSGAREFWSLGSLFLKGHTSLPVKSVWPRRFPLKLR